MKVGIHADAASHAIPGGIGAYVRRLVGVLLRDPADAELRLLVSRSAELPPDWPPESVVRSALPLKLLYVMWNTVRAPAVGGLDLVHATALVMPPAPRLVATVHDDTIDHLPHLVPGFWRRLYQKGLDIALREARVLCANSEATKSRIVERYGVDPKRMVVTPLAPLVSPGHPEDPSVLERFGIEGPFVLHVGTLEPRKNQMTLVRAFAAAELRGHRLVLAGADGWGASKVHREVDRSHTADRIVVTGKLTDAEIAALYARADAFAFPSVYEGFGLPLLEALAYGVPAVASTDDALLEVGADAVIAVDPADEDALAGALVSLCTDEPLRARLRASGPERAALYTWERTAEATRGAWRRALSEEP